jgi:Tol biopolymer transport system component
VKEIYIGDADGTNLRFVMTFRHHHMWHPNSRQVIGNCDDGLYIVNYDGSGKRKLSDLAQGHPSFSPDGTMIVTDSFGQGYEDMVVLIDPETGEVTPLASCPTVHGRSHEVGTHPHPSWAPDSKSVIYDSDQEGHCQVYQVFVDG